MIRQLAQCPYCQRCEVALTDSLAVVLNPEDNPPRPCLHLVWVEGRYSQWGLTELPGRKTKIAQMIGSTEFEWQHPHLVARDDVQPLRTYLKELVASGSGWEFASEPHLVRAISLDQHITDVKGKQHPSWEIEGTAVFANNPAAFIESLPACLARQNAPWTDLPGSPPPS